MEKTLKQPFFDPLYWAAFLAALFFVWGLAIAQGQTFTLNTLPLQQFLYLVILYPLLEEMVFRGLIQEQLYQKKFGKVNWYGLSVANCLTSILFVSAHLYYHETMWALAVFFPSLIFGFFRDRYQNIWSSVVLHTWYNLAYFTTFPAIFSI